MQTLSDSLSQIPPSATMAVSDQAAALRAAGRDVIALAGGDPDFDTPKHIQEAAFAAIRGGNTHYVSPATGSRAAVDAIAAKYDREHGMSINPDKQVIVTPGGKWAISLALGAMLNPGDEVLILEPVWVSYGPMITLAGGVPVRVSLDSSDNFRISAEIIQQHITPRTKAIMVTSPNNPTGRVMTQDEADAIAKVVIESDLYLIYDELYEHLIYDGGSHIQLATMPGMQERTILINGLSKAYAMTGWRIGWMVAPEPIKKLAAVLHSQTLSCASSFGMVALAEALNGSQDVVHEMAASYKARRDFMVPALNAIDGIDCPNIEGAFYLFPRFTKTALNSSDFASALLEKAEVAGTPGIAFGTSGENHLRFSIATAMSDLERAVERMAKVVPTL